jgi:hypothetical protein
MALGAMSIGVRAVAQEIAYTGSVHVSTGEYMFTERTTSIALINGLALNVGRVRLSASIPLYTQNSAAVTYVSGVPVPTGGPDAGAVRQRQPGRRVPMGPGGHAPGDRAVLTTAIASDATPAPMMVTAPREYRTEMGDPLFQAGIDLVGGSGDMEMLGVYALAKAPVTGVESGVGTGEWDYGAGAGIGLGSAATFLFADVSYWVNGDLPDLPLRNTVNYAATLGRWLADGRWSVSASVLGASTMIHDIDAPLSLGIGLGYTAGRGNAVHAGVSTGLSESAPDLSAWIGWRVPVGRSGL